MAKWDGFLALQSGATPIIKWGSYYKAGQILLQSGGSFITQWGRNYNTGQLLQSKAVHLHYTYLFCLFFRENKQK